MSGSGDRIWPPGCTQVSGSRSTLKTIRSRDKRPSGPSAKRPAHLHQGFTMAEERLYKIREVAERLDVACLKGKERAGPPARAPGRHPPRRRRSAGSSPPASAVGGRRPDSRRPGRHTTPAAAPGNARRGRGSGPGRPVRCPVDLLGTDQVVAGLASPPWAIFRLSEETGSWSDWGRSVQPVLDLLWAVDDPAPLQAGIDAKGFRDLGQAIAHVGASEGQSSAILAFQDRGVVAMARNRASPGVRGTSRPT
jgi:hypothetical protein